MTRTALGAAAAALVVSQGCSPDRLRPGPPRVAIEVRAGSTVFSPDTLPMVVTASDPNGLDSVVVDFLGTRERLDSRTEVEVVGIFAWPIRAGLTPGQLLTIVARAWDLTGASSTTEATVTVIARAPGGS